MYRYRPRTEGLFARIERWENNATNEVHWRATTKDNITSIYGGTSSSRIADPENEQRVYEWLLQETFDADRQSHPATNMRETTLSSTRTKIQL